MIWCIFWCRLKRNQGVFVHLGANQKDFPQRSHWVASDSCTALQLGHFFIFFPEYPILMPSKNPPTFDDFFVFCVGWGMINAMNPVQIAPTHASGMKQPAMIKKTVIPARTYFGGLVKIAAITKIIKYAVTGNPVRSILSPFHQGILLCHS